MADFLHVGDQSFDPEDLTFKEKKAVRRIARTELWEADIQGEFDWAEVPDEDVIAATVAVFMRREDPAYTLDQALELKPSDVMREDDDLPPTSAAPAAKRSSGRASARSKTSGPSGLKSAA